MLHSRTHSTRQNFLAAVTGSLLLAVGTAQADIPGTVFVDLGSRNTSTTLSVAESDQEISQAVAEVLSSDMRLKGDLIAVRTQRGVVSIEGTLNTAPMIYRAYALTRELPGVAAVNVSRLVTPQ